MKIFLTLILGGDDATAVAEAPLKAIKAVLTSIGTQLPAYDFDKLDFRVNVAGEIWKFKKPNGFNDSLVNVKQRSARVHVTIQRDVWAPGAEGVRRSMLESIVHGVRDVERKAVAKGLKFGAAEILDALRVTLGDTVPSACFAAAALAVRGKQSVPKTTRAPSKTKAKKPARR